MRQVPLVVVLCIAAPAVLADGGAVRYSAEAGPWHVTAFTEPTPLRAGPVVVSFLIQDAGEPVLDAAVEVRAACAGTVAMAIARRGAATNQMLYAAPLVLAQRGDWTIEATITAGDAASRVRFTVAVEPPRAWWLVQLPWLAVPVVGLALFASHQVLAARRRSSRAARAGVKPPRDPHRSRSARARRGRGRRASS